MPTAQANILIQAKETASQVFQQMFAKNSAAMGAQATAVQKLNATYAQFSQYLTAQANAAANAVQPNAQLVAQHTQMARAANTSAQQLAATTKAVDTHKISIVDLAAKLYLLQVGFRNVLNIAREMFELAELGATVQQQGLAFKQLAEGAGKNYIDFLGQLRDATQGTISDMELQAIASKALIGTSGQLRSEMIEALPKILEISKAYSDLHPEVGGTEFAFESLVTGIRRSSIRLIDNAGIVVKLGELYDTYAKSIGKSADALSAEEQQLAIVNGIQREGLTIIDQAGNRIGALTDRYEKFRASAANVHGDLGRLADFMLGPSVDAMNDFMSAVHDTSQEAFQLAENLSGAKTELEGILKPLEKFSDIPERGLFATSVSPARLATILIKVVGGALDEINDKFFNTFEKEAPSAMAETAEAAKDISEEVAKAWAKALNRIEDGFVDIARSQEKMEDFSGKVIDISTDLQDKLTSIHEDAAKDRFEISKSFNERGLELEEKYFESRENLEKKLHDLKVDLGMIEQDLSPAARQLKEFEDALRGIESMASNVTMIEGGLPTMLGLGGAATVERILPVLKDNINRLQEVVRQEQNAARVKALEDEIMALDDKYQKEMEKLREAAAERLGIIAENEREATNRVEEESAKRVKAIHEDISEMKVDIETNYRMAWVEAMLEVAEKGSLVEQSLRRQRLELLGLNNAQIQYLQGLGVMYGMTPSQPNTNAQVLQQYLSEIGRASGGDVTAGRGYIVGENGPEWFSPAGNGMIIPGGAGGGVVNVSINAGAYMGSEADAARFGQLLIPILSRALQSTNTNIFAAGTRRTSTLLR